jgi:hypothetical protein
LTLAERIYAGQEVILSYYGNGSIVDEGGNRLQPGQLTVSNRTEKGADPAPVMLSAVVYEGDHANRLALSLSESVSDVSEAGFELYVDGERLSILTAKPHSDKRQAKIWLTASERIYQGEAVTIAYDGKGSVVDAGGNGLSSGSLEVTNRTDKEADPAPRMVSAVVYPDKLADRLALNLSEVVSGLSAGGFSVRVGGRAVSVLSVKRHPTVLTRLWLKLSDPVTPGKRVRLDYDANGQLVDDAGQPLQAGSLSVSNET